MTVASKWSQMVCLSSTVHSWRSTRLWSVPVRADGAPRRQCTTRNGAALDQARRTKERRYPELTGEAHDFLRHLAHARARPEPPEIRAVATLCGLGADGEVPSTSDVVWGDRFPS